MPASNRLAPKAMAAPYAAGPPAVVDEATARKALAQRRTLANLLLLGMALVFAATFFDPDPGYFVGLIRAASEAGIVGGMADWFAVTALFRRPLGLPIPHTAILPRSKERIGLALAGFIEQSFLTEAVLRPRLRAIRPAQRAAQWLSDEAHARVVVDPVLRLVPDLLRALDDAELRAFLNRIVREELRNVDMAPLAGHLLRLVTQSGEADVLFERAIAGALKWGEDHGEEIERLVQERSRWWIPRAINRQIARRLMKEASAILVELADPQSQTRASFQVALVGQIERLTRSESQAAEWNAARDRLLDHPELQAWVNAIWTQLSAALARDLAEPDPSTRQVLERAIATFGRALASDDHMQSKIDDGLERVLLHALSYREKAGAFMADIVRSWDAKTITERFELVIGGDLQYIRMNGTVVGAVVGSGLYLATHWPG